MTSDEIKGLIEEILYIWGEPLDFDDLSRILFDIDKKEIKTVLEEFVEERNNRNTGLIIRKYGKSYQFSTRKSTDKYLEKLVAKSEKKLSNSTLETLSIIAYKQPITRAEIDKIRGVNSQSTIDSLLDRGLIVEKGRLDKIGKPIIFGTTDEFLKYFSISSLEDLPEIKIGDDNEDK